MRPAPASSALLLRYADAAGYGAVSFDDEEEPVLRRKKRRGFWRAFLSFLFLVV